MRYLMTFSYDGTLYNGYQKQPDKNTIQDKIEESLTKINNNEFVSLVATGRTDKGVHALNQKAHFDLNTNITSDKLKLALNSMLPNDIYIKDICNIDNDFHARFKVLKKEYVYKINLGEYNPIDRNYIYQYNKKLNIKAMKKAIKFFVGNHNFKSFTSSDDIRESYDRIIYNAKIECKKDIISIIFIGNGFLRYMVRNMVGTLIEIGEGIKKPKDIQFILDARDRTQAGKTAPAEGLYLKNVYYK